jgi:hypothetical protein
MAFGSLDFLWRFNGEEPLLLNRTVCRGNPGYRGEENPEEEELMMS